MRDRFFFTWQHALLTSFGLLTACGGEATQGGGGTSTSNSGSGGGSSTSVSNGQATSSNSSTGATAQAASATSGAGGTTVTIPDSVTHRPVAVRCSPSMPSSVSKIPPEYQGTAGGTGQVESDFACEFDSECTSGVNGRCAFYEDTFEGAFVGTRCQYGCNEDGDCGDGVCECEVEGGRCVSATCNVDDDCDSGICMRTAADDGCGAVLHYACPTPEDECMLDEDCNGADCGFDPSAGIHRCIDYTCAIGRPFLVSGHERTANVERRRDWSIATRLGEPVVENVRRRELAARWERIGLMEHASIAAFARFALQLLSCGAPSELIERTQRAMADETRHARLAFGIASHYRAEPVGPGRLAIDGSLDDQDLTSILRATVLEGCIGETVAAAEARICAEHTTDLELGELLLGIARDEADHAELAFAFVRWLLSRHPELGPSAVATAEAELARTEAPTKGADEDAWLLSYGLAPADLRTELRRQALTEMVLPCLRAICSARQTPPTPGATPRLGQSPVSGHHIA